MSIINIVEKCRIEFESEVREEQLTKEASTRRYWAIVARLLQETSNLSKTERSDLRRGLSDRDRGFLFGLAMSAAVAAVRERDPQKLSWGLQALLLEDAVQDPRETILRLCVLNHSAEKVGINLSTLFRPSRELASDATAELFEAYFREGERDLAAMGYEEFTGPDGFDYRRNW